MTDKNQMPKVELQPEISARKTNYTIKVTQSEAHLFEKQVTSSKFINIAINNVLKDEQDSPDEQKDDLALFTERRLHHAVKRLKQKGLYKQTIGDLANMSSSENKQVRMTMTLLNALIGPKETDYTMWGHIGFEELSEELYEKAIELVMAETEMDTVSSDHMYAPLIEKHLHEIYVAVALLHYAQYQRDMIKQLTKETEELDEIKAQYGNVESLMAIMNNSVTKHDYEELQAKLEAQKQNASEELRILSKQIRPIEAKLNAAKKRMAKQTEELDRLRAANAELRRALEHKNDQISALITSMPDETELPDLPDNILVIGGHPNVTTRLKAKYPKWRYIRGDDKSCSDIAQPKCVFLLPMNTCHSTEYRVLSKISPETPVIKISSTNMERIEHDMRRAYTEITPVETEDN